MSVSSHDWSDVKKISADRPDHVIPAFGIHPWKAHLYSSECCTATVADTLDQTKLDDAQRAALPAETQQSLIQVLLSDYFPVKFAALIRYVRTC